MNQISLVTEFQSSRSWIQESLSHDLALRGCSQPSIHYIVRPRKDAKNKDPGKKIAIGLLRNFISFASSFIKPVFEQLMLAT